MALIAIWKQPSKVTLSWYVPLPISSPINKKVSCADRSDVLCIAPMPMCPSNMGCLPYLTACHACRVSGSECSQDYIALHYQNRHSVFNILDHGFSRSSTNPTRHGQNASFPTFPSLQILTSRPVQGLLYAWNLVSLFRSLEMTMDVADRSSA